MWLRIDKSFKNERNINDSSIFIIIRNIISRIQWFSILFYVEQLKHFKNVIFSDGNSSPIHRSIRGCNVSKIFKGYRNKDIIKLVINKLELLSVLPACFCQEMEYFDWNKWFCFCHVNWYFSWSNQCSSHIVANHCPLCKNYSFKFWRYNLCLIIWHLGFNYFSYSSFAWSYD